MCIQATDNQKDIATFVNVMITRDHESRRIKLSSELKKKIVAVILEESKGM